MRIITVNIPQPYLKAIDSLTGRAGLYPSRSELIRVAVRDFLIRELESAKAFKQYQQSQMVPTEMPKSIDENLFVQIPLEKTPAEGITEYKTYRIVNKELK